MAKKRDKTLEKMGLQEEKSLSIQTKLSEEILQTIRNNTGNDKNIQHFINELIVEELEHTGAYWQYKNFYKDLIRKYSEQESSHEN